MNSSDGTEQRTTSPARLPALTGADRTSRLTPEARRRVLELARRQLGYPKPNATTPRPGASAAVDVIGTEQDQNAPPTDMEDNASTADLLVSEGDIAGDYLEHLLDLLDYDGDIDLDVQDGHAVVSIDGGNDLDNLVGSRGQTLDALQELTRLAVQQETGVPSQLVLDIAGWRAGGREELLGLDPITAGTGRTGTDDIDALVEASSLGAPGARSLRDRTSKQHAEELVTAAFPADDAAWAAQRQVDAAVSRARPWTLASGLQAPTHPDRRSTTASAAGWYVVTTRVFLVLEAQSAEAVEHHRIVAAQDNLQEIELATVFGQPAILSGGTLRGGRLTLPHPLTVGETHDFWVRSRNPATPRRFIYIPRRRSDLLELRVRFTPDRLPRLVSRLQGRPPRARGHVPLNQAGEAHLTFHNLTRGVAYGIRWDHDPT